MGEGEVVEMKAINIPVKLELQHGSGGKGSVSRWAATERQYLIGCIF
jgi:hypothetical protein